MLNFEQWVNSLKPNTVFRMLEYRKVGQFTPYEVEQKFSDQSVQYINTYYEKVFIKSIIEIPNNDILLELEIVDELDTTNSSGIIIYKKLSEIELSYFDCDNNGE